TRRLAESTADGGWWPFARRYGQQPVALIEDSVITGQLDLRGTDLPCLVRFVRCRFESPLDLRQTTLPGLILHDCRFPGIEARNLRTSHDVVLTNSLCEGTLNLADAELGGSLRLDETELHRPDERAIYADRVSVSGALIALHVRVDGEIRIPGAKLGGNLNVSGGVLHRPGGLAVNANGVQLGGSLRFDGDPRGTDPARITGLVYLPSAHVAGDVRMSGAVLDPGARPPARDESPYD